MANIFHQHKYSIAIATTGAVAGFAAAKLLSMNAQPVATLEQNQHPTPLPKPIPDPKKEEEEDVYETQKYVNEYLLLHYGEADEVLRHSFVPMDSLEFPRRVGKECLDAYRSVDKVRAIWK